MITYAESRRHPATQQGSIRWQAAADPAGPHPDGIAPSPAWARPGNGHRKDDEVAELVHRLNCAFATVTSIASLTQRHTPDPARFTEAFNGRVHAYAQTYALLLESRWTGARIADIVAGRLSPYADPQQHDVAMAGDDVRIDPRAALALSSTLHELAVNAARHGSLSVPGGALRVEWHRSGPADDARLVIDWRERGGPLPDPSAEAGLGLRLIRMVLGHELQGHAEWSGRPPGVACKMELPVRHICQAWGD